MHTGIQLIAPDGFETLVKGNVYHFVQNDHQKVLLVDFGGREPEYSENGGNGLAPQMARLHVIKAFRFESALERGVIRLSATQRNLPPWLASVERFDIEAIDTVRMRQRSVSDDRGRQNDLSDEAREAQGIFSYVERVDRRERALSVALENVSAILAAYDPDIQINRYARSAQPNQNETRFRIWFWVKVCFPRSRWALMSPYFRIGRWSRSSDMHKDKKFGRPAQRLGSLYGSPGSHPDFVKKIEESYVRHSALGRLMGDVYGQAMIKDYGCKVVRLLGGKSYFVHPAGELFPTIHQFRYRCNKAFGRDTIRLNLWGDLRVRNQMAPSKGRFSQGLANLMERVAVDVTRSASIPVGLDGTTELAKLCIAEMVCETSGLVVGIGFSLGAESSRAYRAAMFCAAIGKQKFCSLFGLDISPEEWPIEGLPPSYTTDRGPGAKHWTDREASCEPAIRSLTPSYTPQSNATVESAHERKVNLPGAPTRLVSRLNPVQMAKQSIIRILSQNNTRDVSGRMTTEMFAAGVFPTPVGVWNYLDKRCRTVAQVVGFEEAVRTFLDPVVFNCVDGGVELHGWRFASPELYEWMNRHSDRTLKGFALELTTRFSWVDVGSRLIEIEAQLPLRDDDSQTYLSIPELEQLSKLMRDAKNDLEWSKHPTRAHYKKKSLEATGEMLGSANRKTGRAKPHTKAARDGTEDFRHSTSKKSK